MRTTIATLTVAALATTAIAQDQAQWVTTLDIGTYLGASGQGATMDANGNLYLTGIGGTDPAVDAVTASIAPDGTLRWRDDYNGPGDWIDQGRALALGPDGLLYVTGNTPQDFRSKVLLLKYEATTGVLLRDSSYVFDPISGESGYAIAVSDANEIFTGGETYGSDDAADCQTIKWDDQFDLQWRAVWDGPAGLHDALEVVRELVLAPNGDLLMFSNVAMIDGRTDYQVVRYDTADGSIIWESNWGTLGEDSIADVKIDANGDIYITGTGFAGVINEFATVKLSGDDGSILWEALDSFGRNDSAAALALDGNGGVYITGRADPDGDFSNFNHLFYTVKRDTESGAFLWEHAYGESCVSCFDVPTDVMVDSDNNVLVVGKTSSPPYDSRHTILFVLDSNFGFEIDRFTETRAGPGKLMLDRQQNIYVASDYRSDRGTMWAMRFESLVETSCRADIDGDGELTIFDFLAFQNAFDAMDPIADFDGDGQFTIFDFLTFQNEFDAGCE